MTTYRIVINRAVVLDDLAALYAETLRLDAILGYLDFGTEVVGSPVAVPVSDDLTAHGVRITWPLDVPANAAVLAYLLQSCVVRVQP